jgi:hypothetical protein
MFRRRPEPQLRHHAPGAPELGEARFRRFLRDFQAYERRLRFEQTLDAFLDLYSRWKRTRDRRLKFRLVLLVFELHRLDGTFQCDLRFQDAPHA